MTLETNTSRTLKYSVFAGILLIAIGLILNATGNGDRVLWTGLLVLIISPFLGVIVSTMTLVKEKDRYWVIVALTLIAISAFNIVLTLI